MLVLPRDLQFQEVHLPHMAGVEVEVERMREAEVVVSSHPHFLLSVKLTGISIGQLVKVVGVGSPLPELRETENQ